MKRTTPLPADLAFLRAARAVLLRKFPAKQGYRLFLRAGTGAAVGTDLYAGRTIAKKEASCGLYAEVLDRKGRLARLSVGSGDLSDVRTAAAALDDAAFAGVPAAYKSKPVSDESFPRKSASSAKAAATGEYRATLKSFRARLAEGEERHGVKFKLEFLSVAAETSSEAYWSSAGGECRQDFSPRFSVGGEVLAIWKGRKDESSFSCVTTAPDRPGALRRLDEAMEEAAQAVRKPDAAYERVKGRVRIDADLFVDLLDELEDHLSLRWAKEGESLVLDKDCRQVAELSPLLTVELVGADGTPYDRRLTDRGVPVQDKPLLRAGKAEFPTASESDLDKYRWPAKKACVGQPVTRVLPGAADITDAETDFVLLRLNALHNLNSHTLEVNLTGSGFVVENGKRRYSSNLVLKCGLLELFRDVQKMGATVRRRHDWSCPDVLVRLG